MIPSASYTYGTRLLVGGSRHEDVRILIMTDRGAPYLRFYNLEVSIGILHLTVPLVIVSHSKL